MFLDQWNRVISHGTPDVAHWLKNTVLWEMSHLLTPVLIDSQCSEPKVKSATWTAPLVNTTLATNLQQ